jgi:membrane protease YdiL (CAAX protease family)
VAFAGYKALLFVWPSSFNHSSPLSLFGFSLLAGVGLGYARKVTGSIWPTLIAHGIFDAWVYMETSNAPWWVW